MAAPARFERAVCPLGEGCSVRLSYGVMEAGEGIEPS